MTQTHNIVCIDVETTGLNPWTDKLLGVSVATQDRADYYPWGGVGAVFPFPWEVLADPTITKLGHNLRFDIKFLQCNGVMVRGPLEDTKLLAQLVDENQSLSLKPLAKKYLKGDVLKYENLLLVHLKLLKLKKGDLGDPRVDAKLVALYCNEDTRNTLALHAVLKGLLTPQELIYYTQEMLPLEHVLLDMELRGNLIDVAKLAEAKEKLTERIERHQNELATLLAPEIAVVRAEVWEKEKAAKPTKAAKGLIPCGEFNWNSGAQKTRLFYGLLELGRYCSELTESGAPSLKRSSLASLDLPEGKLKDAIALQIALNSYEKMYSAYVTGTEERLVDGRVHGEYHQVSREDFGNKDEGGTVTGRLSHRNPNLGNLPRRGRDNDPAFDYWKGTFVKDLFIPVPGNVFLYCDFSQIELRVATHLSQDKAFIEAFAAGEDPHSQTASLLGITRQEAKTVNFLLIYFGSPWRLCLQLGWNPKDDTLIRKAEHIRDNFFAGHPELLAWIHEQRQALRRDGELTSMYGRRRRLSDVWSYDNSHVKHALKQGSNFVVQSVAASIAKRAMVLLDAAGFVICNQVHDSITCQVETSRAEEQLVYMKAIMCSAADLSVPLEVDGKIITTFKE